MNERGTKWSESPAARAEEGPLAELIETERGIETQLDVARAEARRTVESAHEYVRSREGRLEAALDEALARRRATLEDECEKSRGIALARAEVETRRYRAVDDQTLTDLAQWLAARVASSEEST